MKTKHLFGLVAVVAVTGLASSAQAGVSIRFNLGLPVPVFHAPRSVVVYTPPCPPPVVHCPPPVVYVPTPPCRSVVYVAPRYERHDRNHDRRGNDHRRSANNWNRGGQERGGRR